MAQYSGFFNASEVSSGEYSPAYDASDFAFLFQLFFGNGVFVDPTNQLMVQAKSGLSVEVQPGAAFINGYWYRLTEPMQVDFPADGVGTYSVVLQFDGDTIKIPASAVLQNEKIETAMQTSYVLAQVNMTSGMTTISNADIVDRRGENNYCGFVSSTIKQIDTTDLFLQFRTVFEQFMATVEGALDGDTAGNLLNKIVNTQKMIALPYSEETQYQIDDYCTQSDTLLKCIEATTGPYDPTKWTSANVVDDITSIAQSFRDGCSKIAAAITSMGVPTESNASPEQMAANIQKIITELTGNATAEQVLSGYTFYNTNPKQKVQGEMPNNGELNWNPSKSTTYSVPQGYYSGGTLNSSGAYNAGKGAANIVNRYNTNTTASVVNFSLPSNTGRTYAIVAYMSRSNVQATGVVPNISFSNGSTQLIADRADSNKTEHASHVRIWIATKSNASGASNVTISASSENGCVVSAFGIG